MGRLRLFVLVALIAGAVTFLVANGDDTDTISGREVTDPPTEDVAESPTSTEEESTPTDQEPAPGFELYVNRAGYSFEYPESWNLDERKTAVEILAPDSSAALSFGIAPSGDVRGGIGKFLEVIEETYDVVEVRGPTNVAVGATEGVSVEGVAINDDGVRVRFDAYVVDGGSGNFGIASFASAGADDSQIAAILGSFTITP